MWVSGWPITLLFFCLFGSAILPSLQSSPPGVPTTTSSLPSDSGEPTEKDGCTLTLSPSAVVVRFGDPVEANCSRQGQEMGFLGWEVSEGAASHTVGLFLVWGVDNITVWNLSAMCWSPSEQGQCLIQLPLLVFKPPESVSIGFVNHTGPMLEGRRYALQCTVEDVAPIKNLNVTFYKGETVLGQQQQSPINQRTPVTEIFTIDIIARKEDDGAQYWCEARLDLGPEGPQPPPVVKSDKYTATVFFGPHMVCPTKLQVREGESLSCEVRGNPRPLVTWFRDGQVVALPTHSGKKHAGSYTVLAKGFLGQKNFTVEVEILSNRGIANSCWKHFLLAFSLIWIIF